MGQQFGLGSAGQVSSVSQVVPPLRGETDPAFGGVGFRASQSKGEGRLGDHICHVPEALSVSLGGSNICPAGHMET